MLWDLIKTHPRSAAWVVAVWMVTVIVLLLVGPVIHL
jgi:hypothetical protein